MKVVSLKLVYSEPPTVIHVHVDGYTNSAGTETRRHVDEIDHLRNALGISNDPDNLVQGKERMAFHLCVHIFSLCAQREEAKKIEVVEEVAFWGGCPSLYPHQLHQFGECLVIVHQQYLITGIGNLCG